MTSEPITRPHAAGPEKAVVSVLLQYPEKLDDAPHLSPDHFYQPNVRKLFEIISETVHKGESVELVSLTQGLADRGQLAAIGGPGFLADIYSYQPSPGSFENHLKILTGKLACRMAINAADEIRRVATEAPEPSELLEITSAPISAIHDTLTSNRAIRSTRSVISACFETFAKRCKGEESAMGIETSIPEINHNFRGLHPRQTIVISGYPSGGKTLLKGQLAMDAAMGGHNTLYCSLEMPAESLVARMVSYIAKMPGDAVTDPLTFARDVLGKDRPTKQMLESVRDAHTKIQESPFAIEDMIGADVHQIAACIRRAHRTKPLDVVAVDFAQRIRSAPEKLRETREQQLSHASGTLADLAKELGFCLLLGSQLNKEGATKAAEAINEDADLHLQIMQDSNKNHTGMAVMKDRHSGQGGRLLPIVMDDRLLRFVSKN